MTVTARVWPRDELLQSRKKEVQGGFDPGGLGVGGEGAWMLSAMATDMIDKQAALDDALARLEASERRVESLKFRYQEAEASRQRLEGDNAELRRLLHEGAQRGPGCCRVAGAGPQRRRRLDGGERSARSARGEVRAGKRATPSSCTDSRLCTSRRSRRSSSRVGTSSCRRRTGAEQVPSSASARRRGSASAARRSRCREGIIARLEGLLEQSVVDGRRLAEAEAEASRLRGAPCSSPVRITRSWPSSATR